MVNAKNIRLEILYHVKKDEERVASCYGEGILAEMKNSIAKLGLLNPLTVMLPQPNSTGKWYRVIDGSLRLMALKELAREGREVAGRKLTMDSFIRCLEMPRMDKKELEKFQSVKVPHGHAFHKKAADNLFPHQREMIAELVKLGRIKVPANTGKTIQVSTPKGDDSLKMYFDFENQRRDRAAEFAQHGMFIIDESYAIPKGNQHNYQGQTWDGLKAYAAADANWTRQVAETFKRQAEDRVHRPVVHTIDISNLTDDFVIGKLAEKRRIFYEMDFTGAEVAIALHGYGMVPEFFKSRTFDLGSDW